MNKYLSRCEFDEEDLNEMIQDIRSDRFKFLRDVSNGLFEDIWFDPDRGVMKYWPGGIGSGGFRELTPGEQKNITTFCEEFSCNIVGIGTGRIVIRPEGEDFVFKIARFGVSGYIGEGSEANYDEVVRWEEVNRKPILEIFDYSDSYWWIITPVADPLPKIEGVNVDGVVEEVRAEIQRIDSVPTLDIKPANIGRVNGEWCLMDYGKPFREEEQMLGVLPVAERYTY